MKKTIAEMEQTATQSEARNRLVSLFDEDSFVELDKFLSADGEMVSVVSGYGSIDGTVVYAYAQDISVKGGAVGRSVATKIKKVYDLALKNGSPVVGIFDSNGGDIKEGISLLSAYGDIAAASAALSGVVPQVSIVSGVCAGAGAMIACMSDFVIMTEKSEFFMAPPFVAADGKLAGAGSAANAAKSGVASIVAKDDADAIKQARKLISILPQNNLETSGNDYYEENQTVVTADLKAGDLAAAIADKNSIIELAKEFGTASFTALGSINWRTVGFVATNKTADKLTAADSAKIARFVSICDAFSIPVVTIVDTEGFEPSCEAELAGSIRDTAKLAQAYATATTTKVSIITGNAFSSAYIALASIGAGTDLCFAWENAVISPLAPKAAVTFLNGAAEKAEIEKLTTEYTENDASPFEAAAKGFVDRVIAPEDTKTAVASAIDICGSKRVSAPAKKHINYVF